MAWNPTDDDFEVGVDVGGNAIRDADRSLFPDGHNIIHVLMKGRLNPIVKPQADHILAMAIRRGRLDKAIGLDGERLNAGEAHYIADAINSYGANGLGREDMLEAMSSLPTMERRSRGRTADAGGSF